MSLRNLPFLEPFDPGSLISSKPGQISSMGCTNAGSMCDMALFSFAAGESISEEVYAADMLYICIEGCFALALPGGSRIVRQGQAIAVPRGTAHALEGFEGQAFKMFQLHVE